MNQVGQPKQILLIPVQGGWEIVANYRYNSQVLCRLEATLGQELAERIARLVAVNCGLSNFEWDGVSDV